MAEVTAAAQEKPMDKQQKVEQAGAPVAEEAEAAEADQRHCTAVKQKLTSRSSEGNACKLRPGIRPEAAARRAAAGLSGDPRHFGAAENRDEDQWERLHSIEAKVHGKMRSSGGTAYRQR